MSDFAFLYRGRKTTGSAEEMQQHLQKWMAWFQEMGSRGVVKERGHPLEGAGKVVAGTGKAVTDGPFAEAKDVVAGFTIIEARDLAAAAEIAKGCPILEVGGSVEVRPIQQLSM